MKAILSKLVNKSWLVFVKIQQSKIYFSSLGDLFKSQGLLNFYFQLYVYYKILHKTQWESDYATRTVLKLWKEF